MRLGTSIPTELRPGTGARMLILSALIAAAILFAKAVIFSSFTPGAGCNSYLVIVGPLVMSPSVTSIRNCCSVSLSNLAFARSCSRGSAGTSGPSGSSRT